MNRTLLLHHRSVRTYESTCANPFLTYLIFFVSLKGSYFTEIFLTGFKLISLKFFPIAAVIPPDRDKVPVLGSAMSFVLELVNKYQINTIYKLFARKASTSV